MNKEIMKEMQEVEEMVKEAQGQEEYTEKYFILREGMIKLAGGFAQAALLSSLLGWTRHWLKTDNEIYKQIKAAAEVGDIKKIRKLKEEIRQGWFWKSYREMSEELLGEVSIKTCQRYVEKFEEMGLISSRDPEEHTTYRARWYKANIEKIKEELEKMGYQLDYYKDQKNGIGQNDKSQNKGVSAPKTPKPASLRICQNDKSSGQNDKSSGQNDKHLLYTSFNNQSFNPEGDDDAPASPAKEEWENDIDFMAFRKRFTEVGADDIILEEKIQKAYKAFKAIKAKLGFSSLISAVERYIEKEGAKAQILWFLGDGEKKAGYKKYLQAANKKPTSSIPARKEEKPMPQVLKMVQEQQNELEPVAPEKVALIQDKLRLMHERFAARKERKGRP